MLYTHRSITSPFVSFSLINPHNSPPVTNSLYLSTSTAEFGSSHHLSTQSTTISSLRLSNLLTASPCRFNAAVRRRIRFRWHMRIFSHSNGFGREDWIKKYADFDRVYVAGDSAGGNIAHHMTMRAGKEKLKPRIKGTVIVHPAFWGKDPVDEHDVQDREIRSGVAQVWEKIVSPNSVDGVNDLWFNVVGSGSDFSGMGCEKVLVAVAGKDMFLRQGLAYAAKLKKSGWQGTVEVTEEEAEDHNFHLLNPSSENTSKFIKKFVEFITG